MDLRVLTVCACLCSSALPGDVRLVGGGGRCAGRLQMEVKGEWKPVSNDHHRKFHLEPVYLPEPVVILKDSATNESFLHERARVTPPLEDEPVEDEPVEWNLKSAAEVCRRLDCGSVVSLRTTRGFSGSCIHGFLPFKMSNEELSTPKVEITCSESVRLVNGTHLCSGGLEVNQNQSSPSWSSVCEDDFDLQDAQVVCRELGCGAPSAFKGGLYGDVEAPAWTKEFRCGGHESALLDCDSSDSDTCSSGKAVGLTCSEPAGVRLVGGGSRCDGELEMRHQDEWKPVDRKNWNLRLAGVACAELDCGSAVSTRRTWTAKAQEIWDIDPNCDEASLMKCSPGFKYSFALLEIACSDSVTVRLENGTHPCSGGLEVRSNQSNQSWSSVCEDDFDLRDAQVVCRELGCGAPSAFKGGLYGDVEAPVWTKEFQCGGHESALLDCDSSERNTCSSDKAVGLNCSDPDYLRFVGEASRCAGTLEMGIQGEWRPVADWDQNPAAAACRLMDCGFAVFTVDMFDSVSARPAWWINSTCVQSGSALKECATATDWASSSSLFIMCSDLLLRPNISLFPLIDGVSEARQQGLRVLMGSNFTITCSAEPQYPGGSFQLVFTTSAKAQNYTLPAVNHSAHFLFSAADSAHRGEYRCVYHLETHSHNFSSESRTLSLTVAAPLTELIIRLVVLLLGVLLLITAICCSSKASRSRSQGQRPG